MSNNAFEKKTFVSLNVFSMWICVENLLVLASFALYKLDRTLVVQLNQIKDICIIHCGKQQKKNCRAHSIIRSVWKNKFKHLPTFISRTTSRSTKQAKHLERARRIAPASPLKPLPVTVAMKSTLFSKPVNCNGKSNYNWNNTNWLTNDKWLAEKYFFVMQFHGLPVFLGLLLQSMKCLYHWYSQCPYLVMWLLLRPWQSYIRLDKLFRFENVRNVMFLWYEFVFTFLNYHS